VVSGRHVVDLDVDLIVNGDVEVDDTPRRDRAGPVHLHDDINRSASDASRPDRASS
jgi:hypothetical protein